MQFAGQYMDSNLIHQHIMLAEIMLSLLADNFIDFKIYEVNYDFNLLHDNWYIITSGQKGCG